MEEKPLTLADIAEPIPGDGTLGLRIRRGCRKAFHWLLPRSITRVVVRGGIRYSGKYTDDVIPSIVRKGYWERDQIVFLFNEARKRGARVFLDVGANFGYYSLLAARLGIFDEIHAIEPHPETYKRLLWHVKENKFDGVITPHNVAASDGAGNATTDAKPAGTNQIYKERSPGEFVVVETAPLDAMFDFRGQNICLKIDVEGHEMSALDGAKNLLSRNRVFMQVEFLPGSTPHIGEVLSRGFSLINHYGNDFYFAKERE